MKNLSKREKLFCRLYAWCRNGREAAYRAGYTLCPETNARRLLAQSEIRAEISLAEKDKTDIVSDVTAGLRRIAFGSAADGVKLLFAEEADSDFIESLDLFNVSEVKRPKSGGLEVKFFDRIKALEKLRELADYSPQGASVPLYDALERSASSLNSRDKDDL